LGPVAEGIFLPDELHAAVLGSCCLGGSTSKFSPFGAVDPTSNPARLGIVDQNGNPTSGDVSGPGPVYVKAISADGVPIQKVPVAFGETTVLTNAAGIASFVWDATPGTSLIAMVPNEENKAGPSCPSGIPETTPNTKYRPLVCFTPSSVTFTAPAAPSTSGSDLIVFNDVNVLDNPNNVQLFTNLVSFTGTGSRASGKSVLIHRGHNSLCPTGPGWCGSIQPAFRATLTDQGYTIIDGDDATTPLTSIAPDVKVIILTLPRQTYSNDEINSLKAFAGAGGRIVFIAEYESYYEASGIATENDFLTKMGSAMQNIGGGVDCDWHLLPSSSLRPHQVTAGLTELWMACSSAVQPGPGDYPLFYDTLGEFVLGAVAKLDLTPLPPDVGILAAVQRIDVALPSTQKKSVSGDAIGRRLAAIPLKKPAQ
jgi:hypothetical protein